jgi:hypothetical protein
VSEPSLCVAPRSSIVRYFASAVGGEGSEGRSLRSFFSAFFAFFSMSRFRFSN